MERLSGIDPEYENEMKAKGFNLVIGVDEAGRGPLAGPVVAFLAPFPLIFIQSHMV